MPALGAKMSVQTFVTASEGDTCTLPRIAYVRVAPRLFLPVGALPEPVAGSLEHRLKARLAGYERP